MWNILEKTQNTLVKGYDKRPLLFTEKAYADRMVHDLNQQKENCCLNFVVIEKMNY